MQPWSLTPRRMGKEILQVHSRRKGDFQEQVGGGRPVAVL